MASIAPLNQASRPRLRPGIRLRHDRSSGQLVLLAPERGLALNASAGEIIQRCTGELTVEEIATELMHIHRDLSLPMLEVQVMHFLRRLMDRGLLTMEMTR